MANALEAALGAGLDAAGFFDSTPWLTRLHVRAAARARRELALVTAWHAEALARTPDLPSLAALLADAPPEGGAVGEVRAWAAAAGLGFTALSEDA